MSITAFERCAAAGKGKKLRSVIGQATLDWEERDGGILVREMEGGKPEKRYRGDDYSVHAFRCMSGWV